MNRLKTYTIMPLNTEHVDEICEDIRCQYENGVAECALFSMTLVPEGTPPVDKSLQYGEKYKVFKEKLKEKNLKSGILVQASIGHGYPLGAPSPFQKYINLNDGKQEHVCCPYDDNFCEHFKNVMATLASYEPDVIMVDDDFRLMFRTGNGCACPLHMQEFNRRAGVDLTREELFEHLENDNQSVYAKIYIETQRDALLKGARAMRAGIDSVNPSLPGIFCGCGNNMEFAAEIAEILAGEGNPVIVRINNGNYTPAGARNFSKICYRAAVQRENLEGKVQMILAETDTCPQNRYSTGAQSLHAHMTGTILEGASGAKHWITRLVDYEPESGVAYRKILGRNKGFYEKLADMVPELKWRGCRMPLADSSLYTFTKTGWGPLPDGTDGWSMHVLERMGLPLYFSSKSGGAVFMAENADKKFTDDQLLEMFKGPMFLSSDAASNLIDRGFGEYMGIKVEPWEGPHPGFERLFVNGKLCTAQQKNRQLIPINDEVRVDSMVYHTLDRVHYTPLFPGSTVFHNSLGGMIVVFSGTPITHFHFTTAFSFLNASRKQQMISLLKECGQLPLFYAGDEEFFLKVADMSDGRVFVCLFNIGLDPIEEIVLEAEKAFDIVQMLQENGSFKICKNRQEGDRLIIEEPAYTLNPVVLVLSRAGEEE